MFLCLFRSGVCEICVIIMGYNKAFSDTLHDTRPQTVIGPITRKSAENQLYRASLITRFLLLIMKFLQ